MTKKLDTPWCGWVTTKRSFSPSKCYGLTVVPGEMESFRTSGAGNGARDEGLLAMQHWQGSGLSSRVGGDGLALTGLGEQMAIWRLDHCRGGTGQRNWKSLVWWGPCWWWRLMVALAFCGSKLWLDGMRSTGTKWFFFLNTFLVCDCGDASNRSVFSLIPNIDAGQSGQN